MNNENELTNVGKSEVEDFKELQKSSHYRQTDHNNRMGRLSAWKQNIILVMLAVMLTYFATNYYTFHYGSYLASGDSIASLRESIEDLKSNVKKIVWFDRQRLAGDEVFAKVDKEFPAQYEMWVGDKLIERWHWRVENDPRTEQYGDYILRCVANYDSQNNYIGFTQHQMAGFPVDDPNKKDLKIKDSITLSIDTTNGRLYLSNPLIKVTWESGEYQFAEKVKNGFPHSKNHVDAMDLIQSDADFEYIKHVSKMFRYLKADVIDPYESKTRFAEIEAGWDWEKEILKASISK